jgi:hypothetical protein
MIWKYIHGSKDMHDLISAAAGSLTADKGTGFKNAVSKAMQRDGVAILNGEPQPGRPFQAGEDAFQSTMIGSRIDASKRFLPLFERYRDMAYHLLPDRAVLSVLREDASLVSLDAASRIVSSDAIWEASKADIRRNLLELYPWLGGVNFVSVKRLGTVDETNFCPLHDALCQRALAVFGHVPSPNTYNFRPLRIISILRTEDRDYRRDLPDETILDIITKNEFIFADDPILRIERFLVFIGARPDLAGRVATEIMSHQSIIGFQNSIGSMSSNDQFMGLFTLDMKLHESLVNVDEVVNASLTPILRQLGFMKLFYEGFNSGTYYSQRVEFTSTYREDFKTLFGWESSKVKRIDIYPQRGFSETRNGQG